MTTRTSIALLLLAVATAATSATADARPRVQVLSGQYNVSVDHFRPQSTGHQATFHFDYNVDYFDAGGPLFIYVQDASPYTTEWLRHGLVYDLARELGGALITTESRFFGLNLPTE